MISAFIQINEPDFLFLYEYIKHNISPFTRNTRLIKTVLLLQSQRNINQKIRVIFLGFQFIIQLMLSSSKLFKQSNKRLLLIIHLNISLHNLTTIHLILFKQVLSRSRILTLTQILIMTISNIQTMLHIIRKLHIYKILQNVILRLQLAPIISILIPILLLLNLIKNCLKMLIIHHR